MRNSRILGIGQLGRRLALAFAAVALAAIAVLGLISAATTIVDITNLTSRQEQNLGAALAVAAGAAYSHGGWADDDLMPVFKLVARDDAGAQLRDLAGRVVRSSPRFAALIALLVSLVMARTITGPLELMLEAVRARGAGVRSARVSKVRGVGVVRELLESFNQSANALDQRDRLQRNLVAHVAHELRTPVAILQASHEAMLDGVTDPTPQNLGSLRDEVLRLARMVDDLQRLAAAEAAALQLTLARHDLAAIAARQPTAFASLSARPRSTWCSGCLESRSLAMPAGCAR